MTVTTESDLPAVTTSTDPDDTAPDATAGLRAAGRRVRSLPVVRTLVAQSLTGPAGVVLAAVLIAPGVLVDLVTDATVGLPTTLSFLVAVISVALLVRRKALGTAVVLPPLLYAGAVGTLAWLSGNNEGSRELVLDTGTTLALAAPVLFSGTGLAVLVVLGRLLRSSVRR